VLFADQPFLGSCDGIIQFGIGNTGIGFQGHIFGAFVNVARRDHVQRTGRSDPYSGGFARKEQQKNRTGKSQLEQIFHIKKELDPYSLGFSDSPRFLAWGLDSTDTTKIRICFYGKILVKKPLSGRYRLLKLSFQVGRSFPE
jgi:hypothetical protein